MVAVFWQTEIAGAGPATDTGTEYIDSVDFWQFCTVLVMGPLTIASVCKLPSYVSLRGAFVQQFWDARLDRTPASWLVSMHTESSSRFSTIHDLVTTTNFGIEAIMECPAKLQF